MQLRIVVRFVQIQSRAAAVEEREVTVPELELADGIRNVNFTASMLTCRRLPI